VAVVSGAATGCQLASVFAAFGSRVRLLDVAPWLLGLEDEVVSRGVSEAFERRGIGVKTSIGGVERIEREGGELRSSTPARVRRARSLPGRCCSRPGGSATWRG
jgi:pyruvate/2-oxoglutarate dehydrogenase complex dihydrolipoamide dehydrogenase (E3) component